ncbi:MAG TPA: hypothetical protein PLN06_03105 [Bacteroidales bacterium]|nr:hypothetical protein [Bacteroidales bacterium]HQG36628.1 hypothetical protein [Bacteroidales bacterium]HQG53200.1 hypothetical protein [Bacteroidales bacterium]HQJ20580.1 hypothetical protein [Bacteroidales bacterium]
MKTKAIILTIITLLIGFLLGILVSGQLRSHRLKPLRMFFSDERFFRDGFYNIIKPDENQSKTLDVIISKYAKANKEIQSEFKRKVDSLFKEFWKEVEPNLTKEQIDRLREFEQRRMNMIRNDRRRPDDSLRFRPRMEPMRRIPQGPPPEFDRQRYERQRHDTVDHSRM